MSLGSRDHLGWVPDWAILVCFAIILSLQLLGPLLRQSATFDEPGNLVSGYLSLRFGDDRLIPQNLPLVKLLAAMPLLVGPDHALPPTPHPWSSEAQYRYAFSFLYNQNDGDALLLRGRLAVLPLSILLGCGVFLWAKQLFGRTAAIFGLILYAFEPNVLAHSALITTDIATTTFMFWTWFAWYQLMQVVTWPRFVLAGLALGLALVSKFTALSLFPILLLVGLCVSLFSDPLRLQLAGLPPRILKGSIQKLLVVCLLILGMGIVSIAVIWGSYRFTYLSMEQPIATYPVPWESNLPAAPIQQELLVMAKDARIVPDAYLYGLSHQLRIGGTHEAFLMEEIRPGGWWYYFFVTLVVKTPVPLLLLLVLSIPAQWNYWRSNPLVTACLVCPMLVYLVMISISGWNIGHRHLLPSVALMFVVVSSLASWVIGQTRVIRVGMAGLLCWYVLSSAFMFPHYLAYFNELIGGPNYGHRYLVDSNLDWGQDLKGLKQYMDEQGIEHIWLAYFGQASPEYYRIGYKYLPSFYIFDAKIVDPRVFQVSPLPPLVGTVAISATLLQGGALQTLYHLGPEYFEYYRGLTPVAKIGYSIFIYRVE